MKKTSLCLAFPAMSVPLLHAQNTPSPETEFKVSIARWSNNAKGAVSLYYDDGCPSHQEFVIPVLIRHHIPGTFYVNPNNWTGTNSWLALKWQESAKNPEIVLGNHTWSHSGAKTVDELKEQIANADKAIREMAGLKPTDLVSFAIPGGVPWKISDQELQPVLKEFNSVLRAQWVGMGNGKNSPQASAGGFFTYEEAANATLNRAEKEGSWKSILFHGVGGDWFAFSAADHERLIADCAKRMAEGRVWVAATIDVQKYIAERDNAVLSAIHGNDDGGGEFHLDVKTDPAQYDVPLTLVATVPFSWQSAKVIVIGGTEKKVVVKSGRIVFDVPPKGANISIVKDR